MLVAAVSACDGSCSRDAEPDGRATHSAVFCGQTLNSDETEVQCEHSDVSDLTPLVGLSNLERLDLTATRTADLTPLAGLSKLKELDLTLTHVVSLKPLAGL